MRYGRQRVTIPGWLRVVVFVLVALAFAIATAVIVHAHPELLDDTTLWPLLVVVALVPPMVTLNAIEVQLSARYLGLSIRWADAYAITVLGTGANMLPLPGAMVVRSAALARHGATAMKGTAVTLAFALSWVAMSCLYSGAALWLVGRERYGAAVLAVGAAALIAFGALSIVKYEQPASRIALALATKLGVVVLEAVELYFSFRALALDVTFAGASAIAISSVAGAAIAVVPAGLGVREGAGALVAELVGLGRARGFLAVALCRIVNMIVLVPIAIYLSVRRE